MRRILRRLNPFAASRTARQPLRERRRPSTLRRRRAQRQERAELRQTNTELTAAIAQLRAQSAASAAPSVVVSPAPVPVAATAPDTTVIMRAVAFAKANPELMLLNVGMISSLTGFMMSNVLHLRVLSVFGSVCGMIYNTKNRVWPSVAWGGIFVAVNATMIALLLLEQRPVAFEDDDYAIFVNHFADHGVVPRQFQRLLNAATRVQFPLGGVLKVQGESSDQRVMLLISGSAEVRIAGGDGPPVAILLAGEKSAVIGEIMLLEFLKREKLHAIGRARKGARAAEVDSTVVEAAEHVADMHPSNPASAPPSVATLTAEAQRTARVVDESGTIIIPTAAAVAAVGGCGEGEAEACIAEAQPMNASASVIAGPGEDGCEVLSWSHADLHELMRSDKQLSVAMYHVLTDCLMTKLAEQNKHVRHNHLTAYMELLRAVTSDGTVSSVERAAVQSYRDRNSVSADEHRTVLTSIGWSERELEYGAKGGDPITQTYNRLHAAASVVFDPSIIGLKWT